MRKIRQSKNANGFVFAKTVETAGSSGEAGFLGSTAQADTGERRIQHNVEHIMNLWLFLDLARAYAQNRILAAKQGNIVRVDDYGILLPILR